jgi:translation initiation factor 1
MKNSKNKNPVQSEAVTHNPFAGLVSKLGDSTLKQAAEPPSQEPKRAEKKAAVAKAVVRLERKGRGGKEATIVEGLGLSESELGSWLAELKKVMGCGGTIEGDSLVVQGDQRSRVADWLKKTKLVGRVSVG